MKRRVFVAITLPESLQREIEEWQNAHADLPVRWIAGKNLHLTLVPPWHEENLDGITERLGQVRSDSSFRISFRRISLGPRPQKPRLIWAEGESLPELVVLRDKTHAALNIEPERRPFRPHLTLARFRAKNLIQAGAKNIDEKVNWTFEARSFVLMESRLSHQGADYEVLKKFGL